MWCQRKAPGGTAERLLADADGPRLARRIAEAIHKLHRANLTTERRNTMADELEILRECLAKVAERSEDQAARVARVLAACERLGVIVPTRRRHTILSRDWSSDVCSSDLASRRR